MPLATPNPRARSALIALICSLASPAHADPVASGPVAPVPLAQVLTVAPGLPCLEPAALAAQTAAWLRRGVVDSRIALRVDGAPALDAAVTFVVVRDGEPVAERRFDRLPRECAERRAALGLALALAVDATVLDTLGIEPPPRPPAAVPRAALVAPRSALRASNRGAQRPSLVVWLHGGAALGVLPSPVPLGGATLELAWQRASLRAGVVASAPASAPIGRGSAETQLLAARADACLARPLAGAALGARACVGVLAGRVSASGSGFDSPRAASEPWVALAPRLELHARLAGPLALSVAVDGFGALATPTLTVLDTNGAVLDARRLPPVGAAAELGAGLVF